MKKMRLGLVSIACVLLSSGPAVLAAEAGDVLRPGPEHEKLGFFVGKWKSEGEVMENPIMPGGSFTAEDDCRWFEGKFAVVCDSEGKGPTGKMKALGIMTFSAEDQAYIYYGLDNSGMAMSSLPKGTVQGETWTYHDESSIGGVTVKSRYVIDQLSPKSYSFKWEMLGEDGSWQTVMKGKATRTG